MLKKLGFRQSLPPATVIKLGKLVWTTMWQTMMAQMAPRNAAGEYLRPASQFRQMISSQPGAIYPPVAGRYRLFVGWGCPWAHRTLVVRALKGLEAAIAIAIVEPSPDTGMWVLTQPELGCQTLPDLYQKAKPGYSGRCTVPVLWDDHTATIVNNESADIIVNLNAELNAFARHPDLDLYPADLKIDIDRWNERIYATVNNGVYRCGFAQSQAAYEQACQALFTTLDAIETTLAQHRYLCGDRLTLADVRLFTTLIRFDLVYYGLFKCNQRRLQDYPHLSGYLRELYQLPGIADTCQLDIIKRDYYGNLFPLNPGGIIPIGPDINALLATPHGRDGLPTA